MCKSCSKSKPCKSCRNKKTMIGNISLDKVIAGADITNISATALGVAFGRFLAVKVRNQEWGNPQFRMFLFGLFAFVGGIYGNSASSGKFWNGFYAGIGAAGAATILEYSGIPGFNGIWQGSFLDGIGDLVEDVRYRIGELQPVKKLPSESEAAKRGKMETATPV